MDFVNSACAHAVVAKNQLKNKLVRDFRAAKAITNQFTKIADTLTTGTGTGFGA